MPMKRRLSKQREGAISAEALAIFEEMKQLRCTCTPAARAKVRDDCAGCEHWWSLHPHLRHALGGRLWQFPTISRERPDGRRSYEPDSPEGRWLMLERAARAAPAAA